jgi:hypothetical protein
MSSIQHSLGLILDFGGTRDKTISALSNCGITTATSTIHNKKKQLAVYHDEKLAKSLFREKEDFEINLAILCMNLPIPFYDVSKSNLTFIKWMQQITRSQLPCVEKDPALWDIYEILEKESFIEPLINKVRTFTGFC